MGGAIHPNIRMSADDFSGLIASFPHLHKLLEENEYDWVPIPHNSKQ